MSVIQPVTVTPGATADRASDEAFLHTSRRAYSVDGYSPVLVTIRIGRNKTSATIHTTTLPGGGWWREPTTDQRRDLIDEVLAKHNLKRTGRVEEPSANDWFHRYPIGPV